MKAATTLATRFVDAFGEPFVTPLAELHRLTPTPARIWAASVDDIARVTELPGIGPWTAHYIAMRAFGWPDAFPKEDIVVRNRLGGLTPKQAEQRAEGWRPWRSYAVMHLWRSASTPG